jgi:hypothetical protein
MLHVYLFLLYPPNSNVLFSYIFGQDKLLTVRQKYFCVRGTSPLEGYHHEYESCIDNDYMGVGLAQALAAYRNFAWNMTQGVNLRGT